MLAGGFCAEIARVMMERTGALLLDAKPIDLSVVDKIIETDKTTKVFTFDEMRDALGILPPPPREPPPRPPKAVESKAICESISDCFGPDASHDHDWNSTILCGGGGRAQLTYHYHVCNRCGKEGRRMRVSNKKAVILSREPCA